MMPPPPSTHASWQALHDYAQSHAADHGYAFSINTTAKNRTRIKLACVCYGQPKNTHKLTPETRVRKNRVSYKTGCRMWVEGKKQADSTWLLRVGEPQHNHAGRPSEGWAVQRKRTWGVVGGRIGLGGVTALEEARQSSPDASMDGSSVPGNPPPQSISKPQRGGLIWKVVEQEMLRKGELGQGRDRGVGRTVEVLKARLPGIRIFKRDVYNIRAQIKRARRAGGQSIGQGIDDSENEDETEDVEIVERHDTGTEDVQVSNTTPLGAPQRSAGQDTPPPSTTAATVQTLSYVDPSLSAHTTASSMRPPSSTYTLSHEAELERLRRENMELRRLLGEKTDEVKHKTIEIASLRSQVDYMHIMDLSSGAGGLAG